MSLIRNDTQCTMANQQSEVRVNMDGNVRPENNWQETVEIIEYQHCLKKSTWHTLTRSLNTHSDGKKGKTSSLKQNKNSHTHTHIDDVWNEASVAEYEMWETRLKMELHLCFACLPNNYGWLCRSTINQYIHFFLLLLLLLLLFFQQRTVFDRATSFSAFAFNENSTKKTQQQ